MRVETRFDPGGGSSGASTTAPLDNRDPLDRRHEVTPTAGCAQPPVEPARSRMGARPRRAFPGAAVAGVGLMVLGLPMPARAQASGDPLQEAAWLGGCWLAGSGENTTEEVWLPARGGLMVGMSRSVRGGAAAGYELLVLRTLEGRLVLTAYPSGQEPTDFQATSPGPNLLRVENAEHDFPQRIEYRQPTPDSLVASVFAHVADTSAAFHVRYARGACPPARE